MSSRPNNETIAVVTGDSNTSGPSESSCQGCRRRKLRCSRERPQCTHCRRIDIPCLYGQKKKPGLKPGTMDNINRRLEALEASMSRMSELPHLQTKGPSGATGAETTVGGAMEIISLLAKELHQLNNPFNGQETSAESRYAHNIGVSPAASSLSRKSDNTDQPLCNHAAVRKRRRLNSSGKQTGSPQVPLCDLEGAKLPNLPPAEIVQLTINAYFDAVQPWVPILHEERFRKRVSDPLRSESLLVVLHAMVVAALRFVDPMESNEDNNGGDKSDRADSWANVSSLLSSELVDSQIARSRKFVILTAMDGLSVENLQALSIIAFTDIGNGDAPKAWSIVGSLTRTVEYLQLSVEKSIQDDKPLLGPLISIPDPSDWTEEEERRRVFWNIFNLDRFCSVITGWNTSLTANDVHRRLPADGGLWHSEEYVSTPFFGIWDQSTVKMGRSIMFLPVQYTSSPGQGSDRALQPDAPVEETGSSRPTENEYGTTIGAYAYCIEATESLSRVANLFLRQKINFKDRQEVSSWLTRFKELDLRLVHWKLFLPSKWKDSNISRHPGVVDMDPNLTLAHITHNASTILLHQRIAYPDSHWANIVRLPSAASSDTCQSAACETATIAEKYLKYTPRFCPATSQFAFCLFVSARVLLVHSKCYKTAVDQEFWSLASSLDELALRWAGPIFKERGKQTLAGKYARQLRYLHRQLENDPNVSADALSSLTGMAGLGNTPDELESGAASRQPATPSEMSNLPGMNFTTESSRDSIGLLPPRDANHDFTTAGSLSGHAGERGDQPNAGLPDNSMAFGDYVASHSDIQDNLSVISQMLTGQDFLNMDRVISFEDSMFSQFQ